MTKSPLDQLIDDGAPATRRVRICMRADLIAEHEHLSAQLEQAQRDDARLNRTAQAPGIAQQISDLEDRIRESEVELVLQAIGASGWSDLLAAHPPTKKQKQEAAEAKVRPPDHNPDTFPYAAVAASLGEPEDKVRKFADKFSLGEWTKLWAACLMVNVGETSVPKSDAAWRVLQRLEQSSTPSDLGG